MKHRLPVISALLIGAGLYSPDMYGQITVSGSVRDREGGNLPMSVITAIQLPDSVARQAAVADEQGRYSISLNDTAHILLKASMLGYRPEYRKPDVDGIDFVLAPDAVTLSDLVVNAKARLTGMAGGYSFTPGYLVKHVSSAHEVLNYVPLINVSGGQLDIITKNPDARIYVNGEESTLPKDVLMQKLRSMPPDAVKRVEIIMNPGAMEDRETQDRGIVNIILDDRLRGFMGSVNATFYTTPSQSYMWSPKGSLFWQNHNLLLGGTVSYYGSRQTYDEKTVFEGNEPTDGPGSGDTVPDGTTRHSETTMRDLTHKLGMTLFGEYRMGRDVIIGRLSTSTSYSSNRNVTLQQIWSDDGNIGETRSENVVGTPWSQPYLNAYLRYKRILDSEGTSVLRITAGLYDFYKIKNDNNLFVSQWPVTPGEPVQDIMQSFNYGSDGQSGNVRYEKSFADNSFLRLQYTIGHDKVEHDYSDTSEHYRFNQGITTNRLGAMYRRQVGDRFQMSASIYGLVFDRSLRYEEGPQTQRFDNTFLRVSASVSLSLSLASGLHNLNLDWYSNPDSPDMSSLNPHRTWIDATSYRVGNPNLGIGQTNKVSLGYLFLRDYFLSIDYMAQRNGYTSEYVTSDSDGNTVFTYLGGARTDMLTATFNYSKNLFDYRLRLGANAHGNWRNYFADRGDARIASHSLDYSLSAFAWFKIIPSQDFSASANYTFSSSLEKISLSYNATHRLSVSLKKEFGRDGDISLSTFIPLNKQTETYLSPGVVYMKTSVHNYPSVSLSFSWRFGKRTIQQAEQI